MKDNADAKPRQLTIDLSQMAVPIQLAQEKKHGPESPRPSTSEAEPRSESAGNPDVFPAVSQQIQGKIQKKSAEPSIGHAVTHLFPFWFSFGKRKAVM